MVNIDKKGHDNSKFILGSILGYANFQKVINIRITGKKNIFCSDKKDLY